MSNVKAMTTQELMDELERAKAVNEGLKAENERIKSTVKVKLDRFSNGLSFKRGDKGTLSVYGLGRFPVALYGDQWLKLCDIAQEIKAHIESHRDQFPAKVKPVKGQTDESEAA